MMKRLNALAPDFSANLQKLLDWSSVADASVQTTVDEIIQAIRDEGDVALLRYTAKFDRLDLPTADALAFTREEIDASVARTSPELLAALTQAAARIRA
ncbi:MAG: histidinol dehydrogenase, partial [Halothiobacillus sp.]|nr:histidinol dehydrogenase [Halothiobacillus sp.]